MERHASLEFCPWTYDCDGIAILSEAKPKIFIKAGQPRRRERFTLGHELGHVLIPWHVNAVGCKPMAEHDSGSEIHLGVAQEAEANRFASHLLVPDRFTDKYRRRFVDPREALAELETAGLSAAAGILALQRALLPGYVFYVPGLKRPVYSVGTLQHTSHSELRKVAVNHGTTTHQDKSITWYQVARDGEAIGEMATKQEATAALRALAITTDWEGGPEKFLQKVNGVIGAAFSQRQGLSLETLMGILNYRFSTQPFSHMMTDSVFLAALSFKAREFASRNDVSEIPAPQET